MIKAKYTGHFDCYCELLLITECLLCILEMTRQPFACTRGNTASLSKTKWTFLYWRSTPVKYAQNALMVFKENSFFVINRAQLKNATDWLVTNVGAFEHRGLSGRILKLITMKFWIAPYFGVKRLNYHAWEKESSWQEIRNNVFYRHRKYNDFLRAVTVLEDCHGNELQLGLIEYNSQVRTIVQKTSHLLRTFSGHQTLELFSVKVLFCYITKDPGHWHYLQCRKCLCHFYKLPE